MPSLTANWLAERARQDPRGLALVVGNEGFTWAELAARVRRLAGWMEGQGIGPGDRVAIWLPNGLPFVLAMHATAWCGASFVALGPRLSDRELETSWAASAPSLVVVDAARRPRVPEGLKVLAAEEIPHREARLAPSSSRAEGFDGERELAVIFTSGSSGRPRGVRLTRANFHASAAASAARLGAAPGDRWLACLPFCHVGGLSILWRSVLLGSTAIVQEGFDPEAVWQAVAGQGVTMLSLVPTTLQRWLEARPEALVPKSLRCVLLGGGPATRALLTEAGQRGVPVAFTYGLTEATSQVATLPPLEAAARPGSVGRPLPGTEIRLASVSEGDGAEDGGKIEVRGPTVARRDLDGAFLTDAEGWLSTGDVGRLDEEGNLYVLGRADDTIVRGGENLHPLEVEQVLREHPAVADVCVGGVPDPTWGHLVAAWVRRRPGMALTAGELEAHARAGLAPWKVPRRIEFVDDFPRSAAGKILRRELIAAAGRTSA